MPIATKTGDNGTTSLIGGIRVSKSDKRLEAYGTVDELNATLGIVLNYCQLKETVEVLSKVQHHLFTIGAELASLNDKASSFSIPALSKKHLDFVESALILAEERVPVQRAFIIPKGSKSSALLHLARTVCRRTERNIVSCNYEKNEFIQRYINRLSDLLFIFARLENSGMQEEYVVYD